MHLSVFLDDWTINQKIYKIYQMKLLTEVTITLTKKNYNENIFTHLPKFRKKIVNNILPKATL